MVVDEAELAVREENTYEDNLKEHLLVDLHELLVPLVDVGSLSAGIGLVILSLGRVVAVVLAPLDDLAEDSLVDLLSNALVTGHGRDAGARQQIKWRQGSEASLRWGWEWGCSG